MSRYFFIQSQDVFTEVRTSAQFNLAKNLARKGNSVSILLVQNGVVAARKGARSEQIDALLNGSVTVLADNFSLEQREIDVNNLKSNIKVSSINVVIDALLNGDKVIWN
jgi:predicted peroxiredoxin